MAVNGFASNPPYELRGPLIGRANLASRQARRADWSRRPNPPLDLKRWRVTASPPTRPTSFVMAGLVRAIHDLFYRSIKKDVDARDKPGHDELRDPAIATRPFFLHRQSGRFC